MQSRVGIRFRLTPTQRRLILSAVEGLELVHAGDESDPVVSDVAMPATDGPTMIREVRKLRPAMAVLFMSGYCERQLSDQIGIAGVPFLPSRFRCSRLRTRSGRCWRRWDNRLELGQY